MFSNVVFLTNYVFDMFVTMLGMNDWPKPKFMPENSQRPAPGPAVPTCQHVETVIQSGSET
jgi:hypothetical protein